MQRITEIFFSRKVAWPVLLGSSATISVSTILLMFGFDTMSTLAGALTVMIGYFSLGVFLCNEERRQNQ